MCKAELDLLLELSAGCDVPSPQLHEFMSTLDMIPLMIPQQELHQLIIGPLYYVEIAHVL
jgi:hypothetical protein